MSTESDTPMNTTTQNTPNTERKRCQHLTGYWINRGINFRCYECQHQLWIADLPKNPKRAIEVWEER